MEKIKTINLFELSDEFIISKFAGGECHIKFLKEITFDSIRINTRLNTSDDIMVLCLAVDALRRMDVKYIEVFIPYIPYARQDRVMVKGEALSVKVFASIINSLHLDKVMVFDAHSDVSVALIDRCVNIPNYEIVHYIIKEELQLSDFVLVSPDIGAYKKIEKLGKYIGCKNALAVGMKVRNLDTGDIIKSEVMTHDEDQQKAHIIVDDICDGGRTFMEIAEILKQKNIKHIYLIVSHGIFSHNALENLQNAGYKNIYSSNSITDRTASDFFKQVNIFFKE
jgi:ribose-phosphate pyrophosphokinase